MDEFNRPPTHPNFVTNILQQREASPNERFFWSGMRDRAEFDRWEKYGCCCNPTGYPQTEPCETHPQNLSRLLPTTERDQLFSDSLDRYEAMETAEELKLQLAKVTVSDDLPAPPAKPICEEVDSVTWKEVTEAVLYYRKLKRVNPL